MYAHICLHYICNIDVGALYALYCSYSQPQILIDHEEHVSQA